MRVAAVYDIHGDLSAVEAVLDDLRRAEVEVIVVGGDVVPGPMPCETLDRLQDLARDTQVQFILGNGESAVLAEISGTGADGVPEQYRGIVRWVARQLTPAQQELRAGWPKTLRLGIAGLGEVLFCHAGGWGGLVPSRLISHDCFQIETAEWIGPIDQCGYFYRPLLDRVFVAPEDEGSQGRDRKTPARRQQSGQGACAIGRSWE